MAGPAAPGDTGCSTPSGKVGGNDGVESDATSEMRCGSASEGPEIAKLSEPTSKC